MMRWSCWLASLIVFSASAADAPKPDSSKILGNGQVQEVYRILLNRDDLLLESIRAAIKEKDIQEGAVLTIVGSLQDCTIHFVKSLALKPQDEFKTIQGPLEILGGGGIIAGGEPHIHITLSKESVAMGGHLENKSRVLYLAEVTLVKFSGTPLTRRNNQYGVSILQKK